MKHAPEVLAQIHAARRMSAAELASLLDLDLCQVYAALVHLEAEDKITWLQTSKVWQAVP